MKADHEKEKTHELDEAFKGAILEDKVAFVWKRYRKHTFLLIIFVVAVMAGIQGVSYFEKAQIRALQEEYQDAQDEFQEIAFAEKNPREPLAGLVFLKAGDKAYTEGRFSDAIVHYKEALIPLKGTPLNGRAHIGIAMAAHAINDLDQTQVQLKSVINDNRTLSVIRAEAAYQLALMALEEEDYAKCQEYLALITKLPISGIWGQKAVLLAETTPGLIE